MGKVSMPSMYFDKDTEVASVEPSDEELDNIVDIDGRVPLCSSFGNRIGSMEICDNKAVKGLKCDALILCSNYFLL
jgi:hypothetical protein